MSKAGIQRAADVFTYIQTARHELLAMGTNPSAYYPLKTKPLSDAQKQDMALGQMLSRMNDAVKDDFCRIIEGRTARSQ